MALNSNYFDNIYIIETPLTIEDEYEEEAWAWYPIESRMRDPIQQRMFMILLAVFLVTPLTFFGLLQLKGSGTPAVNNVAVAEVVVESLVAPVEEVAAAQPTLTGQISPIFTPEVRYWEPQIVNWAAQHGLDPNQVAIIMQVESCGDPNAVSRSGAQGLFQVMPFHFADGEDMQDPDTNARRGMAYFALGLEMTNGDIGRSFAGYNGGHGTAAKNWSQWPNETQRYYNWTTGLWDDIQAGLTESPTLQAWLDAGGASLCQQAANRLGLSS